MANVSHDRVTVRELSSPTREVLSRTVTRPTPLASRKALASEKVPNTTRLPHTTPLVYRAEEHMNFRLRRAAAAAAFGACHFGRARAHLPEPASWPRASRGVRAPAPAHEPHDRFKKDE